MIMSRSRVLLASTALQLALFALPGVALAQADPTPPENYTLDPRGVDLVAGTFVYQTNEVAIGPPGRGLVHSRVYVGNGWRDTMSGTIAVTGSTYVVSLGAQSEVFTKSGSVFIPASNRGATLSQSGSLITLTTSDGTVATYSTTYSGSTTIYAANNAALIQIVKPNGEKITFDWAGYTYCTGYLNIDEEGNYYNCRAYKNAVRIDSIHNNFGYRLNFEYATNTIADGDLSGYLDWLTRVKVTGVNDAVERCRPYGPACTVPWPYVTYVGTDSVTDQGGRITTYTQTGVLNGVRFPGSASDDIVITRGTGGRVSGVTDASGAWTYTFTDSGTTRTATATGPLGQAMTSVADMTIGRATSVTQTTAPGVTRAWTYGYDAQRRLQRVTNPEGDYAEVAYDARGNVTQTRSVGKAGSGVADIVTSAAYPATCSNVVTCNLPTSTTDARGATTDYTWDSTHGGMLTVTAPAPSVGAARPQTRITYAPQTAYIQAGGGGVVAASGAVTLPVQASQCVTGSSCIGTADEVRTTLIYGSSGVANNLNLTTVSQGSGANPSMAVTSTTYTALGDVATMDGPLSGTADTTRFIYDDARRNVGVIGPDPDGGGALANRAQRTTYNPSGLVTLAETGTTPGQSDSAWTAFSPIMRTATTYDAIGRPVEARSQSAAGATASVQQVSYDAAGRLACVVTRMNSAAFSSLPSSACTPATAGAEGPDRITQMAYDYAGRTTHVTTAAGLAEAITQVTAYTANGQTASLTDGNGNVSIVEYDGHDRAVKLRYPNPSSAGTTSTTDYEEVSFDPAGNVTMKRNRDGGLTAITYDSLNRPTLVDAPSGTMDLAMTYDNLGRVLTAAGNGQTLTNVWDPLSGLTSETGPLGTIAYQYDSAGRTTRITWPDAFYAQYDYDTTGAVTGIRENGAVSGAGVLATYTYNALGQTTGIARGNGVITSYAYDSFFRLSGLSHDAAGSGNDVAFGYAWNAAGQIASRTVSNADFVLAPGAGTTTYANDGLNRVTSVAGTAVSYDANQNISSALGSSYGYDAANRLTSATINGSAYGFTYDPANRLHSSSASGERFLYSGQQLVGEYGASGALLARHIPGPGLDVPVASLFSGGVRYQQIADERGSVIGLTNSVAKVMTFNRYDEYGVASATDRFQYTGQAYLAPGLYNYRARAYAPQLGRFLQTDPIGYQSGPNIYSYVRGDPINLSDPMGLQDATNLDEVVVTGRTCEQRGGHWRTVFGDRVCVRNVTTPPQTGGNGPTGGGGGGGDGLPPGLERVCHGPPAAPGTGSTRAQLRAQVRGNGEIARSHEADLLWFRRQVPNGAPWDYKQYHRGYENFGNYNYGYTGWELGLAEGLLLRQAGRAQQAAGTSRAEWGSPGLMGVIGGNGSFGDDPRDQEMIRRGIEDAQNGC